MIPRRTQLLAVASVVLAALSALAHGVVALVPALRASVVARFGIDAWTRRMREVYAAVAGWP